MVWVTDIHLNFLDNFRFEKFVKRLLQEKPDALLITGDIAEAQNITSYLDRLTQVLEFDIFFVLGNHDFYNGSMKMVRGEIEDLSQDSPTLNFLDISGPIKIDNDTALVGHSGWADGRFGDFFNSHVQLNDYVLIEDFKMLSKDKRYNKLNELGDTATRHLKEKLDAAFLEFDNVICLTHVPPFKESCWHLGAISNADYLPHFSCKAMGEMMLGTMKNRPSAHLMVLCGHTHSPGKIQLNNNIKVFTGGAEYGKPEIQSVNFVDGKISE